MDSMANGTQSPPPIIDKPLTPMTLSTEPVNATDLVNVTKVVHRKVKEFSVLKNLFFFALDCIRSRPS